VRASIVIYPIHWVKIKVGRNKGFAILAGSMRDAFARNDYDFRPIVRADLEMIARWLRAPAVVRWWGNPDEQLALVTSDLDEPQMHQWIVAHAGRPFAYVQAYRIEAWPQPHFQDLIPGTIAIDAFVGEEDMLGIGHGARFLRAIALQLCEDGAPDVVIDPDVDNARARRAYRRAGFGGDRVCDTGEGPAVVMQFMG
jgi:aminoglycoside 6'-N-acetyltransferase